MDSKASAGWTMHGGRISALSYARFVAGAAVGASAVIGARFVLESYLDGEEALFLHILHVCIDDWTTMNPSRDTCAG